MSFNGNFLIIGGTPIDEYIKRSSLDITPNQRQDLDSYRDADGVLHRTVLNHTATKIEFETTYLNNTKMAEFTGILNSNFTSSLERKLSVTYYDAEHNDYKSGTFYVPDFSFKPYLKKGTYLQWEPVRFAFIEY